VARPRSLAAPGAAQGGRRSIDGCSLRPALAAPCRCRRARCNEGRLFEGSTNSATTSSNNLGGGRVGERRIVILLTREVGAAEPHTSSEAGGCQGLRERWRGK
jgi:hypothetical protein